TDLNGAPLEMTDADGAVRWSGDYGSFGAINGQTQDSEGLRHGKPVESQPLRYAGQYADDETGLHYNLFRYYDPTIGRFTTQDPIGLAGGINLYQYAPNPIRWVDPLGLSGSFIDPRLINFSQSWVSSNDYAEVISHKGWIGDPLNVIIRDGKMISFDNRRLDAALSLDMKEVPITIVEGSGSYPKSTTGKTWDNAFNERLSKNGLGQYGTPERPAIGKVDGEARIKKNRSNRVGCS
ncbi:RHS repeat-associated core domain-containing protein, partial [Pectobacterium versatile]|uniref:RHS repeat-associated core domain-containing protein n=1 Tax=Pectobacterium versatile TaxID=2488639 RepID=UPI0027E56786